MQIEDKLTILADAAKYDVSCASSGSRRNNTHRRLGHTTPGGICHSYTEDGRCISLLKLLYTNFCIYDCAYCVNRKDNDIPRAAFTSQEIVDLTIDFYRRNYIEGLFLSSGVFRSPDETMEQLVQVVRKLREQGFNGYIHLKCVPHTSRELIRLAGQLADRLSVNIELPTEKSLKRLAREKSYAAILKPMDLIRESILQRREDRRHLRHAPAFAPAGQSTQLIIGASPESDYEILRLATRLYDEQHLKRVYYSAFMPPLKTDHRLPDITSPPLIRENRLYQADWLVRLYGFALEDLVGPRQPNLDLDIDPKQTFARRHPEMFPVDINLAERELILRVPGIGLQSANRILKWRRLGRIRFEHLKQMGVAVDRALPYIFCDGLPTWGPMKQRRSWRRNALSAADVRRNRRRLWVTDGSFEGLLSATFAAYKEPQPPVAIEPDSQPQLDLFHRRVYIPTDQKKAERVWKGLKTHLGASRRHRIYQAFLSGVAGVETSIYQYIFSTVEGRHVLDDNVRLAAHIKIDQLSRKVRREAHRLKGFVRFQQVGERRYLAMVSPKYDVLPLIRRHFEHRLADQQWVIYDTRRGYGMFFDRLHTRIIRRDIDTIQSSCAQVLNDESLCQILWKRYYQTASIAARSNPRLHLRQLPRRFWRYLPEKQVSTPFKTKRRGRPKRAKPLDTRSEFDCKRNTV